MDDKEKDELERRRFKAYRDLVIAFLLCYVLFIVEFIFLIVSQFGG